MFIIINGIATFHSSNIITSYDVFQIYNTSLVVLCQREYDWYVIIEARGDDMGYYPRLRDLREDADLTQEELVKLLKMHKTTYTNYEQGKREPPFELIIKLAKFYDVSIDYIAGLSEDTSIKK